VAIDLYLVWAVRSGRDVALAVAVAVAANVASVLTAESLSAVDTWVSAALHAVFPLTVWRMHRAESPKRAPATLEIPSERTGNPQPAEASQIGAQRVSDSWPPDDLWADFEDSAPDETPVTPPKPDHVRAVIAEMTSAGRPVTGQAIADHYGVSPRTGRRYLSLAT
jgi:hypothetical protein